MSHRPVRYVISVLSLDHVGLVAEVAEALYRLDANLEALSQTVVGEWFTMIIRAAFPEGVAQAQIKDAIEHGGVQAIVAPIVDGAQSPRTGGEPYVVTALGADQPGIACRFARCFADLGVNIEDVWNEIRGGQFIEIFHVTVPSAVDPKELRHALNQAAGALGMNVTLQHYDIFTATTSLSVHTGKA